MKVGSSLWRKPPAARRSRRELIMKTTSSNSKSTQSLALDWIRCTTVRAAATPVVESLEGRMLMFAPSGMSAFGTTESSVTLQWTDTASNETHFIVDRSVDGVHFKRI